MNLRILDVAPNLIQVKLPLPFELREVNVHLLRGDDGYILIDTGYHAADCFETLEASLQHLRIAWTDIRHVVLTHMHPDHMGNAQKILERSGGARLSMHGVEAEHLRWIAEASKPPWFEDMLTLAGTPETLRQEVYSAFSQLRNQTHTLHPDELYGGGEMLEGRFEIVHTPGHSPGHICLFDRNAGLLLSGDHMLPGITPNIGWLPGENTLNDYLQSLQIVAPFEVQTVVPAHGRPFEEHRGWLKETAAHHEERCEEIRGILADQPKSAHEIVSNVWARKLSPFHYQFAVSEILAHLEYMRRREQIQQVDETGWRLLGG